MSEGVREVRSRWFSQELGISYARKVENGWEGMKRSVALVWVGYENGDTH